MMFFRKILGLGALLSCVFLLPGGLCSAQNQGDPNRVQGQQGPSTSDLEAQPNTYQYPTVRRRRGFTPAQEPAPSSVVNPDPPAVNEQPNNFQPQPVQPATVMQQPPAANMVRQQNSMPVVRPPTYAPQNPNFVGPPAPTPLTLEQMTPALPKVSYQNGLLSVESVNARLVDVLNGIRNKAGIQFEGLQASYQDRVAGKFGPAPAGDVLTELLQGSHFDYVIVGSPENPSLVQRVILTPSSGSPAVAGSAPAIVQQPAEEDDDNSAEETSAESPQQAPPPGMRPLNPNGPKTAEQLLEELKQMQQKNQPQNPQTGNPAPIKGRQPNSPQ